MPIIQEDKILLMTPEGKAENKILVKKLEYNTLFDGLAIKCAYQGWYEESETIFTALLSRTPNDAVIKSNYGASIAQKVMSDYQESQIMNKPELDKSRQLIFEAYRFDKKTKSNWRELHAYKNLCQLRALGGVHHYNQGDW